MEIDQRLTRFINNEDPTLLKNFIEEHPQHVAAAGIYIIKKGSLKLLDWFYQNGFPLTLEMILESISCHRAYCFFFILKFGSLTDDEKNHAMQSAARKIYNQSYF
jgi:hypothetical protein